MIVRLVNPERNYAWGSPVIIPEMIGREPNGTPIAELWLGAHPLASSMVSGIEDLSLDAYISQREQEALGDSVVRTFGTRLPYLMKILAVEHPLSLQVHPDAARARWGFERDEAAGSDLDDPARIYKDPFHKPEMVYALTEFDALCGFRDIDEAREVIRALEVEELDPIIEMLSRHDQQCLRTAVETLLLLEPSQADVLVSKVAQAAQRIVESAPDADPCYATVVDLAQRYPGDPGVVVSLLLNRMHLHPGEAIFVPAGGIHCYLHGLAIEIMATSDNVLRAGLTDKHMDIDEVLAVTRFEVHAQPFVLPEFEHVGSQQVFRPPVDEFELSVIDLDGIRYEHLLGGSGPQIVLCVDGRIRVSGHSVSLGLERGESAFIGDDERSVTLGGRGRLVVGRVPVG